MMIKVLGTNLRMMYDGYKLFEVENSLTNNISAELPSTHELPTRRLIIVFSEYRNLRKLNSGIQYFGLSHVNEL